MEMFDALVVGGGVAGSMAGMLIGKENDVMIVEEHQTPGFPVQCAGLISDSCFKAYSKYCRIKKAVENRIEGALFFSPDGKFVEARGKAYVVERKLFDLMLFSKASEVAEVAVKSKVRFRDGKAIVDGRSVEAKKIIGADGIYSEVARAFGFPRPGLFTALQAEVRFEAIDERFVELYFGRRYTDSFFAYSIPLGDTAKLGVICRENAMMYLRNLIKRHPSVSKRVKGSVIELVSGAIPDRLVSFAKESVALIGDAAGMVKPYTGGGLYYLLVAAEKLSEYFPDFEKYQMAYLSALGKEHVYGSKIRRLYSHLTDSDFSTLVSLFSNFNFRGIHMDSPSTLANAKNATRILIRLLRKPALAARVLSILLD